MAINPNELRFDDFPEQDAGRRNYWRPLMGSLAIAGTVAVVASCLQLRSAETPMTAQPAALLAPNTPDLSDFGPTIRTTTSSSIEIVTTVTTTPTTVRPTTIPRPLTTTTTTVPTTTTTTAPWAGDVYTGSECNQGQTLQVHVQGEDGKALTAQVSADYIVGGQKVDESGQPIDPYIGYSKVLYVNPDLPPEGANDGTRTVCFENIPPQALVYFEVYKKDNIDGQLQATKQWYGDAMTPPVYPGPGQELRVNLPAVCGNGGSTGSIVADSVIIDGKPITPERDVAWENDMLWNGNRTNKTGGFGVEDASQDGSSKKDRLDALRPGRYLFQLQGTGEDGQAATIVTKNVPVEPCSETHLAITAEAGSGKCFTALTVNGRTSQAHCQLNGPLVG